MLYGEILAIDMYSDVEGVSVTRTQFDVRRRGDGGLEVCWV